MSANIGADVEFYYVNSEPMLKVWVNGIWTRGRRDSRARSGVARAQRPPTVGPECSLSSVI